MARIDERRKILEAKLKEMSEDGVMKGKPKETLAFPPNEDEENELQEAKEVRPVQEKTSFLQETNAEGQGKCRMRLPRSHWTITGHAIFTLSVSAKKQPSR